MRPMILRSCWRFSSDLFARLADACEAFGAPLNGSLRELVGFTYPGLFGRPVVTDVLILTRTRQHPRPSVRHVVIATERADNPGASITNTAEHLAAAIVAHLGMVGRDVLWIEHYPPGRYDDPTLARSLSRVRFASEWQTPTWDHLQDVPELAALVREWLAG